MIIKELDSITVNYISQIVGRLAITPAQQLAFEYDTQWLQTGFSISPFFLPLKQGVFIAESRPFNNNFGVFSDSLPDGWGLLLLDRVLKKYNIQPNSINTLQRLALVGSSGMGALSYKPEFKVGSVSKVRRLTTIAAEVAKILNDEEETDSLEDLWLKACSSAGARPKVMIKHNNEFWLVKFPAYNDPPNIGEIEYKFSLLAQKAGIEMSETKLFEGKFFGTKRFDRNKEERFHVISAAGLLHADFRLPALDYTELIKATRAVTKDENEVLKMFRQMVFNVLIGNKDDHAKNFSYIYSKNRWKCSPAYDILPSKGINNEHTTSIIGRGNPDIKDMLRLAEQVGFSKKTAQLIIDEVKEGVG